MQRNDIVSPFCGPKGSNPLFFNFPLQFIFENYWRTEWLTCFHLVKLPMQKNTQALQRERNRNNNVQVMHGNHVTFTQLQQSVQTKKKRSRRRIKSTTLIQSTNDSKKFKNPKSLKSVTIFRGKCSYSNTSTANQKGPDQKQSFFCPQDLQSHKKTGKRRSFHPRFPVGCGHAEGGNEKKKSNEERGASILRQSLRSHTN